MRALIGLDLVKKLPTGDVDIRDTKLTGFVLRCRASGSHTYRVQLGRGQWLTLGRVGGLEPHEARALAQTKRAQSDLARQGLAEDPMTARKKNAATFGAYLTDTYEPWVLEHRKTGAETVARLRAIFADFLDLPLSDLSAFAIEKWRTGRLKAGVRPATVNRDLAALRGACTKAREWKLMKAHPLATVKAAKVDTIAHVRFLTDAEETRLRAALTARDDRRRLERERANAWRHDRGYDEYPAFGRYTDHLTPIVLLAINTGLRRGELLALTWGAVDLVGARVTVRSEDAKSGRKRVVPLNRESAAVLSAWRPTSVEDSAYVFPGDEGERRQELKTAFLPLLREAKITQFRFHDLRHHFASRLVQAGVDLNRLRALLGHADTKMVLRYAHLREDDLSAAVAKLNRG